MRSKIFLLVSHELSLSGQVSGKLPLAKPHLWTKRRQEVKRARVWLHLTEEKEFTRAYIVDMVWAVLASWVSTFLVIADEIARAMRSGEISPFSVG
ncbi:hypothetical protein ABZP36_000397 [Zizania latifolia]